MRQLGRVLNILLNWGLVGVSRLPCTAHLDVTISSGQGQARERATSAARSGTSQGKKKTPIQGLLETSASRQPANANPAKSSLSQEILAESSHQDFLQTSTKPTQVCYLTEKMQARATPSALSPAPDGCLQRHATALWSPVSAQSPS